MRRWVGWLVAVAVLGAGIGLVRLPLYAIGPGSAHEVLPLITVERIPEYRTDGQLIITTIAFRQVSVVGALAAWLDPSWSVVPEDELFVPGETEEQEERRAASAMDQSKIDAIYVVLRRLSDYPRERRRGLLVERVIQGCPATGRLFPGDLVLAVNGQRVDGREEASRILRSSPPGEPLVVLVRAGGELHEVELSPSPCAGSAQPLVGVVLVENFPFRVRMAGGPVGGPSAGLMWALGLYDLLTPGDLTGGRVVAGTGSIDLDGAVGGIGSIDQKVRAAARVGAELFLVPRENLADARAAGADLRLVPVGSFDQAVRYLERAA